MPSYPPGSSCTWEVLNQVSTAPGLLATCKCDLRSLGSLPPCAALSLRCCGHVPGQMLSTPSGTAEFKWSHSLGLWLQLRTYRVLMQRCRLALANATQVQPYISLTVSAFETEPDYDYGKWHLLRQTEGLLSPAGPVIKVLDDGIW
jgi:hypothetical protein